MSRWLVALLLVCSAPVFASPASAPAESQDALPWTADVRGHLVDLGDSMAGQAHDVADRTSDLVTTAMGFLGVPYRRGGTSAATGFDCSGFVRSIVEQTRGLVLPHKASEQAATTEKIAKKDLQPGDLVFFNTMRRAFSHVGIYIGDGKFIHSPRTGLRVRVEDMHESYWSKRFNGARRVVGDAADDLASNMTHAPSVR